MALLISILLLEFGANAFTAIQENDSQNGETRFRITGTVTDPEGTITDRASVDVYLYWIVDDQYRYVQLTSVNTNRQGSFEYQFSNEQSRKLEHDYPMALDRGVQIVAKSARFAPDWVMIPDFKIGEAEVQLKLAPATVAIMGRITDTMGDPVVGAQVIPTRISGSVANLDKWHRHASQFEPGLVVAGQQNSTSIPRI